MKEWPEKESTPAAIALKRFNSEDPYIVLGLPRTASDVDFTEARNRLLREYHPDSHPENPHAVHITQKILDAYGRRKVSGAKARPAQQPQNKSTVENTPAPKSQEEAEQQAFEIIRAYKFDPNRFKAFVRLQKEKGFAVDGVVNSDQAHAFFEAHIRAQLNNTTKLLAQNRKYANNFVGIWRQAGWRPRADILRALA